MPPGARDAADVEKTSTGQLLPIDSGVARPEQLIAAAHGQERGATFYCFADSLAFLREKVWRDHRLLAVLATAEKHQVDLRRHKTVADRRLIDPQWDATPLRPASKCQDVTPIPVDTHEVGVK